MGQHPPSHTHTHTPTHTHTHTHTYTLSLFSLSLNLTHMHMHTHSLSLTHTHPRTHCHSLSYTHAPIHILSINSSSEWKPEFCLASSAIHRVQSVSQPNHFLSCSMFHKNATYPRFGRKKCYFGRSRFMASRFSMKLNGRISSSTQKNLPFAFHWKKLFGFSCWGRFWRFNEPLTSSAILPWLRGSTLLSI